jgi:hypothetical protein
MFKEGQACAKLRVANLAQTTGSGECSLWAPITMAATSMKHVLLSGLESYGTNMASERAHHTVRLRDRFYVADGIGEKEQRDILLPT